MNYCVRKYICNFDTTIYVDPRRNGGTRPYKSILVGQVAIRESLSHSTERTHSKELPK